MAALLHDIGVYVSLRAHHKHSQYLLAASQIFGLSNDETAIVSNIARYHRRGTPQRSHLPYVALDRHDRLIVNKLAAILRRRQRARRRAPAEGAGRAPASGDDRTWVLELDGHGDLTMEQLAATARADMFVETFGRELLIRPTGVAVMTGARSPGADLFINRELSWLAFNERVLEEAADQSDAPARAAQVRRHRRVEPRRVLHGPGRGSPSQRRGR